ncbi:Pentatricopeptide repeat [Quillaja saponaria]|uniref:Pentatricopeptide repeat n=1 Tax=Quillaja saponaria TaxID=32244 RepID=A0AAD7KT61_QUISA|nr:Pentatricopeptide repeat [Quillaja saponaria]
MEAAYHLFEEIPHRDSVSLSICINPFEALDIGRKVHAFIVKLGCFSYISVANSLLKMYAKSGNPLMAKIALAQRGLGEEAIELFEKMLDFCINPYHKTYVGVLYACTHVRLVEQGRVLLEFDEKCSSH